VEVGSSVPAFGDGVGWLCRVAERREYLVYLRV
jgi:hypothetical protein